MSAARAFEKFEKQGFGLWPVLLLSAIAIGVTLFLVKLSSDMATEEGLVKSEVANVPLHFEQLLDEPPHWRELKPVKASELKSILPTLDGFQSVVSSTLPEGSNQVGFFQFDESIPFYLWVWEVPSERALLVCTLKRNLIPVHPQWRISLWSINGDRDLVTGLGPWFVKRDDRVDFFDPDTAETASQTEAKSAGKPNRTGESMIDIAINSQVFSNAWSRLAEAHRKRMSDSTVMPDSATFIKHFSNSADRVSDAWVTQPSISDLLAVKELSGNANAVQKVRRMLVKNEYLIKSQFAYEVDAKAIDVFRNQLTDTAAEAEIADELVVLHSCTTVLHVAEKLHGKKDAMEYASYAEAFADGDKGFVDAEEFFKTQTSLSNVKLLGEIQQPFPAKIYRVWPKTDGEEPPTEKAE